MTDNTQLNLADLRDGKKEEQTSVKEAKVFLRANLSPFR